MAISTKLNSVIMALALVILAGLLAWLSTRYPVVSDWTRSGRHSLSAASRQVLSKVTGDLTITAYAREQEDLRSAIRRFVARYQRLKPDIRLHFVNPDAVPDEARALGINENGELAIHYQGRLENIRPGSEEVFTNALQRLLQDNERWLAFVEGHGERNPLGKSNHDLGEWGRQISNRGFKIQPLNLARTGAIPDNTTVIVIAGPLVNYLPGEVELIVNYLARGGNLLWLAEPNNIYGLDALAGYLGIEFPKGAVIDFAGQLIGVNDPRIVLVTEQLYGDHPALEGFKFSTLFPMTTMISARDQGSWKLRPLIRTGDHTWQETGELKGDVGFDADTDTRGPFNIAISLERKLTADQPGEPRQQRIIVAGDGDFLANTYIGNSGNLELGMRLINWLSSDEEFISIPAKFAQDTQLEISQLTAGIMGFGFLIVLPVLLLGTGGLIWWRRKNL